MTNEEYQRDKVKALKLTHGRVRELYFTNVEILEKHLTLKQREKLMSLKTIESVPSHAVLVRALRTLSPIFTLIKKENESIECRRLLRYLGGWSRETI